MLKKAYPLGLVVLLVAIVALNFYAYRYHWYWEYRWFDRVMHTLGGICVSSTALWWRYIRPSVRVIPRLSFVFLFALSAISVVGVGWEIFELSFDTVIIFAIHSASNTASDLFFDGVGSTLGVILFLVLYNRGNEKS